MEAAGEWALGERFTSKAASSPLSTAHSATTRHWVAAEARRLTLPLGAAAEVFPVTGAAAFMAEGVVEVLAE